jgi:hypothetical protein
VKLVERALAIPEKVLGPEHPDTATSLNNLALLLQGPALFERALAIREQAFESEHPGTNRARYNLSGLFLLIGRPERSR